MMRVLLADPDPVFSRRLQLGLEKRGLVVEAVCDGYLALNRLQLELADVCLLDPNLSGLNGLTVLRRARASEANMPVAVLMTEDTAATRVTWFDAGADDIVRKPFDPDELAVRLRAMHRRLAGRAQSQPQLRCGPLVFDILSGSFLLGDALLEFTPREHAFVKALIARPGFLVPKDRLFRAVFGDDAGVGAIDVLACRLRRKLMGTGVSLTTVRGLGYLLEEGRRLQSRAAVHTHGANSLAR
jgi:two-component system response regulator TctD